MLGVGGVSGGGRVCGSLWMCLVTAKVGADAGVAVPLRVLSVLGVSQVL